MPDDYVSEPDERDVDPVAQAAATAALAEQMRREEAALVGAPSRPPIWTQPPQPLFAPRTRSYGIVSPGTPPNFTRPFTDASGRVDYEQMSQELGRVNQAIAAQRQFEARQRIQQDLEAGVPPDKAFARWGMDLLGGGKGLSAAQISAFAKTLQPRPQATVETLPDGSTKVTQPTGTVTIYRPIRPPTPPTQTVSTKYEAVEGVPGRPAQPGRKGIFGIGARPAIPAVPEIPAQPARTITERVPVTSTTPAPTVEPPGPRATTSRNEVIRTTKDGRKAVFDADTKQFLRYAD